MEELAEGFGKLSTSAKEWKPASETSTGTPTSPKPSWQPQQYQATDSWNSPATPTSPSHNWQSQQQWGSPQQNQVQQTCKSNKSTIQFCVYFLML